MKRNRPPSTAPARKFSSLVFTFLFSVAFFLTAGLLQAQLPELVRSERIFLDSISFAEQTIMEGRWNAGNLLMIDENRGIAMSGRVNIKRINLQTAQVEKKLDMDELLRMISESLHEQRSEEHCIAGRESFRRNKPPQYGITFCRVLEYTEPSTFALMTHSVVLDQEDDNERDVFYGLLVFNEELELLNFHPIEECEKFGRHPRMHSGGFFDGDLMFMMRSNKYHQRDYDFVKYQLKSDGNYHGKDTTAHWPLVPAPLSTRFFFSKVLERDGVVHLMLGDKMLMLEDWDDSGTIHKLPIEDNQYLVDIKPIEGTDWNAAIVANTRITVNGDTYFASWEVSLIDDEYRRAIPQTGFRYREHRFRSLSVIDHRVVVMLEDVEDNRMGVDVLEFQMVPK